VLVNWRVGVVCGLAGTVLAVAGAWISDSVDGHLLMVATALLLLYTGLSTLTQVRRHRHVPIEAEGPEADLERDGNLALRTAATRVHPLGQLVAAGAGAGALAGLLGLGGGVVMMPVFTRVLRIPMKVAVATSLVAVAMFSVPALVTHAALGHINWAYSLLLVAGTVPGAQIGSKITLGASDRTIQTLFGLFLTVLALVYGTVEASAFLG